MNIIELIFDESEKLGIEVAQYLRRRDRHFFPMRSKSEWGTWLTALNGGKKACEWLVRAVLSDVSAIGAELTEKIIDEMDFGYITRHPAPCACGYNYNHEQKFSVDYEKFYRDMKRWTKNGFNKTTY